MDLNDYENDPYAPDPRASQRVAAQQRARPTDRPTAAPASRPLPLAPVALVAAGALLIGVLSYGLGQSTARPLQLPPTEQPARAFVPAPTEAPAPTSAPTATIPPTVPPLPVAPQEPPGPAPQTGQGLTYSEIAPAVIEAAPPPLPPPPTETPVPAWPTSAPASPADFAKPDIRGTCQFVGCLGQKAVDLARAETCHALYWQYGDADSETIPEPDLSAVRGCIWEGLYR